MAVKPGRLQKPTKNTEQFPMPMTETDTEDQMADENDKQKSG